MAAVVHKNVEQYRQVHASSNYGSVGVAHRDTVMLAVIETGARTLLDHGCGQGLLHEALADVPDLTVYRYDPAVPGIDQMPVTHVDLIVSTDVLEHVPDPELDSLLEQMRTVASHVFWTIATRPAKLILPNGENAHCTVHPANWWVDRLGRFFPDVRLVFDRPGHSCALTSWAPRDATLYLRIERSTLLRRRIEKVALLRLLRRAQHLEL